MPYDTLWKLTFCLLQKTSGFMRATLYVIQNVDLYGILMMTGVDLKELVLLNEGIFQ